MAAPTRRRLRKGAVATAVAAAAMAALTASQAPGLTPEAAQGRGDSAPDAAPDEDDSITGDSPYYTDLPPLESANPGPGGDAPTDAESGIPATVLAAYKEAAAELRSTSPGCNLRWELLAAIGRVESGHARGGNVDADGTTRSPILGPVLNGDGFARISDTDGGELDGDSSFDRAVGPMQFIPSTWATWGADGNGDGTRSPDNVYDASLAAGRYLCAGGRDLSQDEGLEQAILGYNHSQAYLRTVLSWYDYYKKGGAKPVPDGSGPAPGDRSDGRPSPSPSPDRASDRGPRGSGGSRGPEGGGGTSPSPTPPPDGPGTPSRPMVADLRPASSQSMSAFAGAEFGSRPQVRAVTSGGAGVSGKSVTFEIRGDTDARFAGGAGTVTRTTSSTGYATAPTLVAGQRTGRFTVRASVGGSSVSPVVFTATVKAPVADGISRVGDGELSAAAGGEFATAVEAKATYKGAAAAGVAVSATMITSVEDPSQNDSGPFFTNAAGEPVRSLTDLKTDGDGMVRLPKIHAGDVTGTFLLRLATAGGATLTLELKVT